MAAGSLHPVGHLPTVLDQVVSTLAARDAELRLEQAVRGIDHLTEVGLQALIGEGLAAHHRVTREAYYPSAVADKRGRARCDFVLTPQGQALHDDCAPEEALWLELKVAHQLLPEGRRNPRYGQQWRASLLADLRKMKTDPLIRHAALALVVFNDSRTTLEKDAALFETILASEQLLCGFRSQRSFSIEDRIGHAVCGAMMWPLL